MLTEEKISLIVNLGLDLSQAKDLDLLLDRVLTDARKFVNADAGSIYIRKGDQLEFSYTQNDTLQRKLAPGKKLIYSSSSMPIDQRSIAGYVAGTGRILNLPDVYHLPHGIPYSFSRKFDEAAKYRTQSMLTIPLKTLDEEVIGVLQLINAKDREGHIVAFESEEQPFIQHFASSAAIAIERAKMTRSMILRIIEMARLRDPKETGAHVKRVAAYSLLVYERWAAQKGLALREIERNKDVLKISSMLHDVGKVAISDSILKKPARLSPDEFAAMKQHTWLGANLFTDQLSIYDQAAAVIALHHHEKWDGSGYPGHIDVLDGLPLPGFAAPEGAVGKKGEEIPAFGRVVAIADVFDALSSSRSYKQAWTEEQVLETMKADAGRHFDPEMTEAFFFDLDAVRNVRERYPEGP